MEDAPNTSAGHTKSWNQKRLLTLGTAILVTLALPISIDQGFFRYNAYALPILGLFGILLYIAFLLTIPEVASYCLQIHAINPGLGKVLGVFLSVLLLGGLAMGFRVALSVCKRHVEATRQADTPRVAKTAPTFSSLPPSMSQLPKAKSAPKHSAGNPPLPKPAPTVASPVPIAPTNNCPNGICISGGLVTHPEVNNYATPAPPQILEIKQQLLAPIPKFRVPGDAPNRDYLVMEYNNSLGFERSNAEMTSNPGLQVMFHMSSSFTDPDFRYRCDHPCVVTSISTGATDGQGRSWSNLGLPPLLTKDVEVIFTFRSVDQTPILTAEIEPITQTSN
jgi:hypothetical protein